jgi:hypothetical protein
MKDRAAPSFGEHAPIFSKPAPLSDFLEGVGISAPAIAEAQQCDQCRGARRLRDAVNRRYPDGVPVDDELGMATLELLGAVVLAKRCRC